MNTQTCSMGRDGLEELPDESRDDGTDDGGYDEHPDLLDGQGVVFGEHHECGSEGPGGVDGCSGESDSEKVDQDQGETDDDSSLGGGGLGGGHTERGEDEDERQEDLDEQGSAHVDFGHGCGAESVGAESVCGGPDAGLIENQPEEEGSDDTADELEDDVSDGVPGVDPHVDVHSDGDRRVDVASGHASDAVGHGDHGQAEGESGGHDAAGRVASDDHGEPYPTMVRTMVPMSSATYFLTDMFSMRNTS